MYNVLINNEVVAHITYNPKYNEYTLRFMTGGFFISQDWVEILKYVKMEFGDDYELHQLDKLLTVGELIDYLQHFPKDMPLLKFTGGDYCGYDRMDYPAFYHGNTFAPNVEKDKFYSGEFVCYVMGYDKGDWEQEFTALVF